MTPCDFCGRMTFRNLIQTPNKKYACICKDCLRDLNEGSIPWQTWMIDFEEERWQKPGKQRMNPGKTKKILDEFDLYGAMFDVKNPKNWQIFRIKSMMTLTSAMREAQEERWGLAFTLGESQTDATERIIAGKTIEQEEAIQFLAMKYSPDDDSRYNPTPRKKRRK